MYKLRGISRRPSGKTTTTDPPGASIRDDGGVTAAETDSSDGTVGGTGSARNGPPVEQSNTLSGRPDRRDHTHDRSDPYDDVPKRFRYDPYPSWFVRRIGLLKVTPPERIRPHVSEE